MTNYIKSKKSIILFWMICFSMQLSAQIIADQGNWAPIA